jgi:hypothetical protein
VKSPAVALAEALEPSGGRVVIDGTSDLPGGLVVQHVTITLAGGTAFGGGGRAKEETEDHDDD